MQKLLTVHCVHDGTFPVDDPFKELREIYHTIDNYGDTLPSQRPVPTAYFPYENSNSSSETHSFHMADTLRSLDNETYDLGELPGDLVRNRNDEIKYNVLMRCVSLHT